jgi:chromosome segregation ATPase
MMDLILGGDRFPVLIGLLAQLTSLVFVAWMLLRMDRRIDEGQSDAQANAERAARALEAMRETHQALLAAADGVTEASRTWTKLPPLATEEHINTLVAALELQRMAPVVVAEAPAQTVTSEPSEAEPREAESALLHERRLRGKVEGEVSELRRRLEHQTQQLNEANRDRRNQVNDAARAASLEATNGRLLIELRDSRRQFRELQTSLGPMSLELKSLRSQLQQPEPKDESRDDGVGVYLDRIRELERIGHDLEDALATLKSEHERTRREQLFIEEHYLRLDST